MANETIQKTAFDSAFNSSVLTSELQQGSAWFLLSGKRRTKSISRQCSWTVSNILLFQQRHKAWLWRLFLLSSAPSRASSYSHGISRNPFRFVAELILSLYLSRFLHFVLPSSYFFLHSTLQTFFSSFIYLLWFLPPPLVLSILSMLVSLYVSTYPSLTISFLRFFIRGSCSREQFDSIVNAMASDKTGHPLTFEPWPRITNQLQVRDTLRVEWDPSVPPPSTHFLPSLFLNHIHFLLNTRLRVCPADHRITCLCFVLFWFLPSGNYLFFLPTGHMVAN